MAHMIDEKGPYPDKAGEYCGNYRVDSSFMPLCCWFETPDQAAKRVKKWLSKMRFGRLGPRETKDVTIENGWVGLYLREDRLLFDWETPCPCPPELLEPETN